MRLRFSHLFCSLSCICLVYALPSFAEGCNLSDTTNSPIQSYRQNIDTLNTFIHKQAESSTCEIPSESSTFLMKEVSSLGFSGSDFSIESDAFLDPAGPINELKPHRETIEEIERSILETTQYVGSRCAGGQKITEDAFGGQGAYNTQGRTITQVLGEMARETSEVKRFFNILGQGIQTEEYIDEVPFPIAFSGFSSGMYVYYSPKKLQECRDNSPRKQAFTEMIKNAFTAGWKYPQAMQVWKDAMALLLYRGDQMVGGASDAGKDAQIERIVQAQRGGLGNSDIMINSQFFKEFGYRPDSKTPEESSQSLEKKTFYERTGYEFVRKVLPNLVEQESGPEGQGYIRVSQTTEELAKVSRLQEREKSLYTEYGVRREGIAQRKAQDGKTSSPLVNTVGDTQQRQGWFTKLGQVIHKISGKQATNVSGAVR